MCNVILVHSWKPPCTESREQGWSVDPWGGTVSVLVSCYRYPGKNRSRFNPFLIEENRFERALHDRLCRVVSIRFLHQIFIIASASCPATHDNKVNCGGGSQSLPWTIITVCFPPASGGWNCGDLCLQEVALGSSHFHIFVVIFNELVIFVAIFNCPSVRIHVRPLSVCVSHVLNH